VVRCHAPATLPTTRPAVSMNDDDNQSGHSVKQKFCLCWETNLNALFVQPAV